MTELDRKGNTLFALPLGVVQEYGVPVGMMLTMALIVALVGGSLWLQQHPLGSTDTASMTSAQDMQLLLQEPSPVSLPR